MTATATAVAVLVFVATATAVAVLVFVATAATVTVFVVMVSAAAFAATAFAAAHRSAGSVHEPAAPERRLVFCFFRSGLAGRRFCTDFDYDIPCIQNNQKL